MMGQYMSGQEDVVSHLNISNLKDSDGGEYSCTAKNSLAQITRSARINVYGNFRIFIFIITFIDYGISLTSFR